MVTKLQLQSIINKYYLGGTIESTKWDIKNKNLIIKFISPSKDMIGSLEYKNFPLENIELAIFDTTKLNKLISVTNNELLLELTKQNKIATKLHISDIQYNVTYTLADTMMIGKVGEVTEPEQYEVEIKLEKENVDALVQAKKSLADEDHLVIESDKDLNEDKMIQFIFGENNEYSNKISYSIKVDSDSNLKLSFPSNIFKEILVANKDMNEGKIFLSKEGLMKLEFKNKDLMSSEYYLVCKENE